MSQTPPPSNPPPSPFDSGSTPPPSPFDAGPIPPSHNTAPTPDLPWYVQVWATVVGLVVFAPVGIFLMWKYRDWEQKPKVIASIVSLLFFLSFLPKSPDTAATRTAASSPSASAPVEQALPQKKSATLPRAVKDMTTDDPATKPSKKPVSKPVVPAPKTQSKPEPVLADEEEEISKPDEAPAEKNPGNVEVVDIPNVGKREVGIVNGVVYAVMDVETTPSVGDSVNRVEAAGTFFVLTVRAYNDAKKTYDVKPQSIKLLDDQGREFDRSIEGNIALRLAGDARAQNLPVQVQPGTAKELVLVYDAPADADGLRLKIPGGLFSDSGDAVIKLPK